jgi:hypothetical protein
LKKAGQLQEKGNIIFALGGLSPRAKTLFLGYIACPVKQGAEKNGPEIVPQLSSEERAGG